MNARTIFVAMVGMLVVCVPALADWTEPMPVSEINTVYRETAPFLSFDGLTLYFGRAETNTFNYARIYQATRPEPYGSFTSVEEISTLNYSAGSVVTPWVSPDNLRMYYSRNESGSTASTWKLRVTERASIYDSWQPGLNISELNALGSVYEPCLTADELTIVFGGYNLPGNHGYDIWMATRPDMSSPFGNVRNLKEINTSSTEVSPHISSDGLVLYFTSGRNGTGQGFKATRASVGDLFGNLEHLSFLDSPGSSVGGLFLSSDNTTLYFIKSINGQPKDSWVSYWIEPATLVGLEIVGPGEVAENFSAGYKAIAYYDDDSTQDVTDSAQWSVEPEATASIEAGVLTTKDIIKDASATIWAGYTEGDVAFEAEKAIDIFAICPIGTALSFDGLNDYVCVPDDYSLDLGTHDLSFAFWFKTNKSSFEQMFKQMLTKRSTTTGPSNRVWDGYGAPLNADGTVSVFFRHTLSEDKGVIVTSAASYNDNNWHHLAAVYTRSANLKLYVDGALEGTPRDISYAEGEDIDFTQPLAIGCRVVYGRSNDIYFNGSIDEVAIYNRALSGEEIRASMHTRLAGDEPGLVGYWDFDEGGGQIVYDLSGNGNDGQLGSTPDVDESDPAWVESDAQIGHCTPYLIAIGAAKEALKHKRASLEELEAALAKEWTMYEALEQWFESGDFGDLSKGDIVKAKQKTDSAIQHEELSKKALEKSIEKLQDALAALGIEPAADEIGQE